jgi:hypothetical protein
MKCAFQTRGADLALNWQGYCCGAPAEAGSNPNIHARSPPFGAWLAANGVTTEQSNLTRISVVTNPKRLFYVDDDALRNA